MHVCRDCKPDQDLHHSVTVCVCARAGVCKVLSKTYMKCVIVVFASSEGLLYRVIITDARVVESAAHQMVVKFLKR